MNSNDFLINPYKWLKLISDYKTYINIAPNFGYDYCIKKITDDQKQTLDLSNWKIAINGSEPINIKTINSFYEAFKNCGFSKEAFYPCYGLAESTLMVSSKKIGAALKTVNLDLSELSNNKIKIAR